MWGFVAQQGFYAVISTIVGAIAIYGARRFRSSGLMALAFTHLLHTISSIVFTMLLWGWNSVTNGVLFSALSIGTYLVNAILNVVAVLLFIRDFNRWKKRLEEAEGQVDRLAQERMNRERKASTSVPAVCGDK